MELKYILSSYLFVLSCCQVFGNCNYEGHSYKNNSYWQFQCFNCTCSNTQVKCSQIKCKYETCKKGDVLTLDASKCCPTCRLPMKSCKYNGYLIDHNTEFSPKLCESCKCRNGLFECTNTCTNDKQQQQESSQELSIENACFMDDHQYANNTIWSPIACTLCKCENRLVKCYTRECAQLVNCSNGIEFKVGECCPVCRQKSCLFTIDGKQSHYTHGHEWTKASDPCTHCKCDNGNVKCARESCAKCAPTYETKVSLPGTCCPKCELKSLSSSYNCEYFGRVYSNGDVWSSATDSCQYCACDYGQVVCTQIQCEAKFCMSDELLVKRLDGCCVQCRKPIWCEIGSEMRVRENEYWSPDTNRLCQCLYDRIICHTLSAQNELLIEIKSPKTHLNFDSIIPKNSIVNIVSSPNYGSILINDHKTLTNFSLQSSKIDYKPFRADFIPQIDYLLFAVQSPKSNDIKLELLKLVNKVPARDTNFLNDETSTSEVDASVAMTKFNHKTIHVVPGEAVKLTSAELTPKHTKIHHRLSYTLVSGKPKYGEIKLKKIINPDEVNLISSSEWTQVNDIYAEKVVKEFSQLDLDNGNVWYEPYVDNDRGGGGGDDECGSSSLSLKSTCLGDDPSLCIPQQTTACYSPLSQYALNGGAKYDHCMFEVKDHEDRRLISKEILHFSIQSTQVINETMLGLEVIENQITPFTFSNFDIAGIDSNREHLVYRIIKNLDRSQGQLEHASRPGISLDTFIQSDLNKGQILYKAPKEIGMHAKEFSFSFIVTNDNRGDTFPETPFHIRVLPANDQAPAFKETISYLNLTQSSSLTLTSELFAIDDPDTYLDNIVFTIEKPADTCLLELRAKGHTYVIYKDESFSMQEIRNGTFRLVHNGGNSPMDSLKISASDGKHVAVKTIYIYIKLSDNQAPKKSNESSMLMIVKEGHTQSVRADSLGFFDDKSSTEHIVYTLNSNKFEGKLLLRNQQLRSQMQFTQADVDLQNLNYEAPNEIGAQSKNDLIYFTVSDNDGNKLEDQVLTVRLEPVDNQAPVVDTTQPALVQEGGYFVLSEDSIRVRDIDSLKEQLNIIIDSQPAFGYFENTDSGERVSSFSLLNLISGNQIRYVQNDHKNKEPTKDSFIFHASDGLNNSPTTEFTFNIEEINDEAPLALFEPLLSEYNKKTLVTNSSLLIVDLDSKPDDVKISVEDGPKYGKLFMDNQALTTKSHFSYANVLDKRISYRNSLSSELDDEIKLKISDGKFSSINLFSIKNVPLSRDAPVMVKNDGLQVVSGKLYKITSDMLKYISDYDSLVIYNIIRLPAFGTLQYRTETFHNLYDTSSHFLSFSQYDLDKGNIYYTHDSYVPKSGISFLSFNATDSVGNTLPYQRFLIRFRDDKLPPFILHNRQLKVSQGSSRLLSRYELDVKDDDTPSENLEFKIIDGPKYGLLEHTNEPSRQVSKFTYDDLVFNRMRYIHDDTLRLEGNDQVDLSVSDGKNEVSLTLEVSIIRYDNEMPQLITSGSMKCKELERRQLSLREINILDKDTLKENLKVIITHPPKYGILERIDRDLEKIQTNKHKHQFPIKNQTISLILSPTPQYALVVSEFTLKDLEDGLIYYYHKITGSPRDEFGYIIFDGVNNMFWINDVQTSDYQTFEIFIQSDTNAMPSIEYNIGLDHLADFKGESRRALTKSELYIVDKDDSPNQLNIYIVRHPLFGIIENKDLPGIGLTKFTYEDIIQNRIFYVLKHQDDLIANDYFLFDVQDSALNTLKGQRFDIKWSIINFELNEISVMEDEGKARVHLTKIGNLKQYSSITCKTLSDAAKSNKDSKNFDFIHTLVRIDFNDGESYKACDVIIHKDSLSEPIESFYVLLEDPKYSVLGLRNQIKVNILDKKKVASIEFEKIKIEVHESDKLVSLPIVRTGDLSQEVTVECYTEDATALSNADYVPRNQNGFNSNTIRIAPGEVYGFCDVELIDDGLHENSNEHFKATLTNPSNGVQIGTQKEAQIVIVGPNDVQTNGCKNVQFTISESSDKIIIDIHRENVDLNQSFDVVCTTTFENSSSHLTTSSNLTRALPNIDYIPINEIIHFASGELTKKCHVTIINDYLNPIMEGLKMFPLHIRPLKWDPSKPKCDLVDPDLVHIIIDDTIEDSIRIGFNQTLFIVNESSRKISIPIVRRGDLSQFVSVICYTRQLTALEDVDYVGRHSLEESRVNFQPGEKLKECTIELIDDTIYEAHEAFQVRLSDLKSSASYAQLGQFVQVTVTITNDEDTTVISLSDENYHTEEPSSNDSLVIKSITVLRTGDLSRASIVRVSTADGSALAGLDYKPKTEILTFEPGVTALDFEIKILYDSDDQHVENFRVHLGPQDPVSASFGKITSATVFIHENNNIGEGDIFTNAINSGISSSKFLSGMPYLTSLVHYVVNRSFLDINRFDDRALGIQLVAPGEPLMCIHACDRKYPKYHKTKPFCDTKFNQVNIKYSWELSTPSDLGKYSDFVKLTENTFFTFTNESVLEPIYYRPKFRLRCVTQFNKIYEDNASSQINNWPLRSNVIEIDSNYDALMSDDLGYNKCSKRITTTQQFGNEQVNLRGEYSDEELNDRIKLTLEVSYSDGMIPLISTQPLYNYRYLLTEPLYAKDNHKCSNFINKKLLNGAVKHGFVHDNQDKLSTLGQFSKWRNEQTMRFYSNLDTNTCQWRFMAYFDTNELINECKALLKNENEMRESESEQNLLTLRIPIYISNVFADIPIGWNFVEHKTSIDLTAIYRILIHEDFESNSNLASLQLSKITILPDYKLSFELLTESSFTGHFLKAHPSLAYFRGNFKGPSKSEYALELTWSQFSSELPEQMWKVKSYSSVYVILNTSLNDEFNNFTFFCKNFIGNYTLELIPCVYKKKKHLCLHLNVSRDNPFHFSIVREQAIKPVPLKYSLDTNIHLLNKPSNFSTHAISSNKNKFDGLFRKNDHVYGTVTWNPKLDLKSMYRLQLEKVYVCSGLNGYIPLYDPDGSVYKKGPQYGCLEGNMQIGKRFLVLDRTNPDNIITHVNTIPFDARFITHRFTSTSKNNTPLMDAFKFNLNPLFSSEFDKNWFVQVLYFIGPESSLRSIRKRESNNKDFYVLTGVYNNGTNIQWLKLSEKKRDLNSKRPLIDNNDLLLKNGKNQRQKVAYISSLKDLFLKLLLPFLAFIFTITLTAIGVYYFKKKAIDRLRREPKEPPFPVIIDNSTNSRSSSLEIIPTQLQTEYTEKSGHVITKVLKLDPFNDDSNCTLQTVISSATSTSSSVSNESNYAYTANNSKPQRSPLMYTNRKLKTFFKRKYAPVASVDPQPVNPYNSLKNPKTSTNNYLYYNYNSNDLNRDVVKVNSSMTSLLAKKKSSAGTEV